jgi:hypothetical protein
LLSRIPAVKWAFTRLRPSSQGEHVELAPIAASGSPHIVPEIAEAAPILDTSADIAVATAVAGDNSTISAVAESPAAVPTDISLADDPSLETPTEVEAIVVEEVSVSPVEQQNEAVGTPELIDGGPPAELLAKVESVEEAPASSVEVESEPVDIPEPVVESSPELPANVEPVVAEGSPVSVEAEIAPADAPVLVVADDLCSGLVVDVEPAVVDSSCVDREVAAKNVSESKVDDASSLGIAAEIEPIPANDPAPVAAVAAEIPSAEARNPTTDIAPEPLASPAPKIPAAPKPRARVVEPTDRAALIRQRWAETGVRMWNPRLHGTGEATLNIQGSIGLLPPSPGETMPRYDKLEFKMLGGQIVCEGIIVAAPAQAGHRNFTRLAEPAKPDRVREPARERQAALA